jgi:O-antigen ligase
MAFPMLLVLSQNLSLLFFAYLFYLIPNKLIFFKPNHWIQVIVWLFMVGAIASVLDLNPPTYESRNRALAVLPNYIYWSIMLLFLINLRSWINIDTVAKYIYYGLIISLGYYLFSDFIPDLSGFTNHFTPNSYAFLCISFTAPAATYVMYKKGYLYALVLVIIILITLLLAGRRAGFILVFLSSMLSIHLKKLSVKQVLITLFLAGFGFQLLQLELVENALYAANPRVHELIYENEDINTTDRSLLTRKLMVEKSLIIMSEHPLTGIGLNNFAAFEVDFRGDFEGAEFVLNKDGMNEKSAHNSYASLLGEGGLLLILPFLIIVIFNIIKFLIYYTRRPHIENTFYLAFLSMCVHFYFISALLNVYAWFIIGIVTAISVQSSQKKIK